MLWPRAAVFKHNRHSSVLIPGQLFEVRSLRSIKGTGTDLIYESRFSGQVAEDRRGRIAPSNVDMKTAKAFFGDVCLLFFL